MAKRKPEITSQQMEKELGYGVQALASTGALTCLYSDLRPVTNSAYGRIEREYQEHQLVHDERVSKEALQALGGIQTTTHNRNIVTLVKLSNIGFYRFAVDIHYEFGVHLPFLLSEREAYRTVSVAKLRYHGKQGTIPAFFKLPREIRDMVYTFALPHGKWGIQNLGNFDRFRLTAAIGDPTGFYFPLGNNLGILNCSSSVKGSGSCASTLRATCWMKWTQKFSKRTLAFKCFDQFTLRL
ncbi:hypothetical protein GQ44DRAFT_317410 [Phaeosphaeriaceae sp. PMI808]|nr:hypothetical protein GQ44DRAFT_317410 [Phaeosphaeriaceae sp. PMI808]